MKLRPVLIALALAAATLALVATSASGGTRARLYVFNGELMTASSSAVQLKVEGGNRPALRALIGQSQDQSFAIGDQTEILVWVNGVPHVGALTDLAQGDFVTVRIRAAAGASLSAIEATQARIVADRGANATKAGNPLYLFVGTVAGGQSGGHISLHVTSGNWRGLHVMLGQSVDQTFTYDDSTIFLLWQGRVPTVIEPSQLQAGDRITIRIRAPRDATLAQVEAVAAAHVGDHEPGNPQTQS
jgi:hypothetical protein